MVKGRGVNIWSVDWFITLPGLILACETEGAY